jgi:hypothetical protein
VSIQIKIDLDKVRSFAKPGHNRCHGEGTVGYSAFSGDTILCPCVWNGMKAKGIYVRDLGAVKQAIGKEAA